MTDLPKAMLFYIIVLHEPPPKYLSLQIYIRRTVFAGHWILPTGIVSSITNPIATACQKRLFFNIFRIPYTPRTRQWCFRQECRFGGCARYRRCSRHCRLNFQHDFWSRFEYLPGFHKALSFEWISRHGSIFCHRTFLLFSDSPSGHNQAEVDLIYRGRTQ